MQASFQVRIDRALATLDKLAAPARLWEKDAGLWRQGTEGNKVIRNRLGWLDVVVKMRSEVARISQFAESLRAADIRHVVLLGMGGSSLSPEVSCRTFGVRPGYPELTVLDSTVPGAVLSAESRVDLEHTAFIVASKSGETIETDSAYRYFYRKLHGLKEKKAGQNFVAITDPGTPLAEEANRMGFRELFENPPDIGGRYSALSYFGLVPAAVIGVDIGLLLDRAAEMAKLCGPDVSASVSPGFRLGATMGELALVGRDKMTLVMSPEIASFGAWVEQLVAESTGKSGRGILPVDGENLASPEQYGDDRWFVYMRLKDSSDNRLDDQVAELERAGQPTVRIELEDIYDIGKEYFRWEVATAVAGMVLSVNPFNEPNVKASKENTSQVLREFREMGKLPADAPILEEAGIGLYCDHDTRLLLDRIRQARGYAEVSLASYIAAHLDRCQDGDYLALLAFIENTPFVDDALQGIRTHLREKYGCATTLGYGPRFLHSTGQLHKGGANNGIFIQFTADDAQDVPIPDREYSFSILKQAQALGDAISLRGVGRPLIRIHLGSDAEGNLKQVAEMIRSMG